MFNSPSDDGFSQPCRLSKLYHKGVELLECRYVYFPVSVKGGESGKHSHLRDSLFDSWLFKLGFSMSLS